GVGAVDGANEEGPVEGVVVNYEAGLIYIGRPRIDAYAEIDRREDDAAVAQRVVPVAVNENVAARRPTIVSGHVDPVGAKGQPEARPPEVARFVIDPGARNEC